MNTYTVYIDFFGKKVKTTVEAANQFRAEMAVRERLRILKIVPEIPEPKVNDLFERLFNIFNPK